MCGEVFSLNAFVFGCFALVFFGVLYGCEMQTRVRLRLELEISIIKH